MSLLDYFRSSKKTSARLAKERLQVVIAHQRTTRSRHEFMPDLQREVLAVIRKYIEVDDQQVQVQLEKDGDCEVLELNITLPEGD